jgi:hypothetical protein
MYSHTLPISPVHATCPVPYIYLFFEHPSSQFDLFGETLFSEFLFLRARCSPYFASSSGNLECDVCHHSAFERILLGTGTSKYSHP